MQSSKRGLTNNICPWDTIYGEIFTKPILYHGIPHLQLNELIWFSTYQVWSLLKYVCTFNVTLSPLSSKLTTLLAFMMISSPTARARISCNVIRLITLVTGSPLSAAGVNVSNLMYLIITNYISSRTCIDRGLTSEKQFIASNN